MTQLRTPRAKKDFIYHVGNVMEQLQSAYLHIMPEQSPDAFKTIWQAVIHTKADADAVAKNLLTVGEVKMMDLILVASAYAAHAATLYRDSCEEIAWTYLVEAQYYAGAALYVKALEIAWPEIKQITVEKAIAATKSKGGKSKNAGWKKVEDEAVRLIKAFGEQGQRWETERKMVAFFKAELWSIASVEIPKISEKRFIQTVSDRLKLRLAEIGIYLKTRKSNP